MAARLVVYLLATLIIASIIWVALIPDFHIIRIGVSPDRLSWTIVILLLILALLWLWKRGWQLVR
jgi:hypothetical protein